MKLTSYTCDYCDGETDEPAYSLSDRAAGKELHFCDSQCLLNYMTRKIALQRKQTFAELIVEWRKFGDALRRDDRDRFLQMLNKAEPLAQALLSSGEEMLPNEALLMAALLVVRGDNPGNTLQQQEGLPFG